MNISRAAEVSDVPHAAHFLNNMGNFKCVKKECDQDRIPGSIFCSKHKTLLVISLDEFKGFKKPKKKNEESQLQIECVNWYRHEYPQYANLLFSIPNGGLRSYKTARTMKAEGIRAGVSDLFLMMKHPKHNGLWIEMKSEKGVVSSEQKDFHQDAINNGFAVAVCRNIFEFKKTIKKYFAGALDI